MCPLPKKDTTLNLLLLWLVLWSADVRAGPETGPSPVSERGDPLVVNSGSVFSPSSPAMLHPVPATTYLHLLIKEGNSMKRNKRYLLFITILAIIITAFGSAAFAKAPVLRMATTTSTDNTGLLDYLAPILLKDTGIEIQWVSVGTGKALEYGRNGDVDIVLTHDPAAEDKFQADGAGVNRRKVMYNDFVLIGPANDPAGIKGKPIVEAMATIAAKQLPIVSRADKSGTHSAELKLFKEAKVTGFDKAAWYVQTGQGMLATINIADERNGYALADRGTFIKYDANLKGKPGLVIVVEGDAQLLNMYTVMAINPIKHSHARYDLAIKYIDWITSSKVQKDIANFKLEGKQLFFPNAEIRAGH